MDTISTTSQEVWKDIPGYESHYKVSNFGRVKSLKNNREKILKLNPDKDGYSIVYLCLNSKIKTFKVHRLVMLSFVGKSELQVDHLNKIKNDNRIENLEYVTPRENILRGDMCQKKKAGCYSKYIGVTYSPKYLKKPWIARLQYKGKRINLGIYKTEEEANEIVMKFKKENNLIR